ncbi:MAG TPA: phage holin family protein [Terriglobales bacterium]|nr:phage holin family protein [Terriglobales bacterium]
MNAPGVEKPAGSGRPENHQRSLGTIVAEIRDEAKQFLNTRVQMIRSEVLELVSAVKIGLPLALAGLLLIGIGILLLSFGLVALVAAAFAGNPYAWFFAFLIVGVLWVVLGGVAAFFAYSEFRGRFPRRSLEVLKTDKVWLQSEARSHS